MSGPSVSQLTWALLLASSTLAAETGELRPGIAVERRLEDGGVGRFAASLGAGAWMVTAEQLGIDVVLSVDVPGADGVSVDLPLDRRGTELALVELAAEARVDVEVRPRHGGVAAGRYRLRASPIDGADRLRAVRAVAAAGVEFLRSSGEEDVATRTAARDRLREALPAWRRAGDRRFTAEALIALASLEVHLGDPRLSLDLDLQAAELLGELYRDRGDVDTAALLATALNNAGYAANHVDETQRAAALFDRSLELFERHQLFFEWAQTRNNLCVPLLRRGAFEDARACLEGCLEALRRAPDRGFEATLRNNLGAVYDQLGEPTEARRHHLAALELRRAAGDRRGEADSLTNLASLDRYTGHWRDALIGWNAALEIYRRLGDQRRRATVLSSLGTAYLALGEPERARSFLERALPLRRAAQDRGGEAVTLNQLANLHHRLGELDAALVRRRESLALRRERGDRLGEARALVWLGRDHLALARPFEALADFDAALAIFAEVDDRRDAVAARSERGRTLTLLGRLDAAGAELERALAEHLALGDVAGESRTRVALAELERRRGRHDQALVQLDAAVDRVEELRAAVPSPELRALFLASRRRAHELRVDLLLELGERRGDAGLVHAALTADEQARARALLDLLAESEIDPARGVAPELRERRRALLARLRLRDRRGRDADQVLAELDRVEAEIRRASPEYAGLTRAEPLDAAGVQALLEPGTALLQYALGEERGAVWWVTAQAVEVHRLPPRRRIEEAARSAHAALTTLVAGGGDPSVRALADLAELVLAPLADELAGGQAGPPERLVVVADGALHAIPFAALPAPSSTVPSARSAEPLLARFEVVHLPSASALAALRRRPRPAPSRTAVVVADPIFSMADPRISRGADAPATTRAAPDERPRFDALPSSRREAEALAELLPADEVRLLLDADAGRDAVLNGALADARIVHLATHGVIDGDRPALSGLVLSRVAAAGRPVEGFLALADVYDLELDAELVVLSGCRTALGREVRGEGLLGLTQGFFHAGTARLVASLWPVEDRATAELMRRFYRAYLDDGLTAAAALRRAQLGLRAERRWRAPYFWAAFVLQGDWR
jgi:CHAT domain-containing protein